MRSADASTGSRPHERGLRLRPALLPRRAPGSKVVRHVNSVAADEVGQEESGQHLAYRGNSGSIGRQPRSHRPRLAPPLRRAPGSKAARHVRGVAADDVGKKKPGQYLAHRGK